MKPAFWSWVGIIVVAAILLAALVVNIVSLGEPSSPNFYRPNPMDDHKP